MSMVMLVNSTVLAKRNNEQIGWRRRFISGMGLGIIKHEVVESIDEIGVIDPKNICGSLVGGRP